MAEHIKKVTPEELCGMVQERLGATKDDAQKKCQQQRERWETRAKKFNELADESNARTAGRTFDLFDACRFLWRIASSDEFYPSPRP